MVDATTRDRLDALLGAIRDRPDQLPLAEVAALAQRPVSVSIGRSGSDTVAVVAPRPADGFESLTAREREVAVLVAAGFSNRQIADALFISLATVKDHVHAILAKSGLPSRTAVAAAWYGGLPT